MISSCSPLTSLLLCNRFMHVSKKVIIRDGSIPGSSGSLLPGLETFMKFFGASLDVLLSRSTSNSDSLVWKRAPSRLLQTLSAHLLLWWHCSLIPCLCWVPLRVVLIYLFGHFELWWTITLHSHASR